MLVNVAPSVDIGNSPTAHCVRRHGRQPGAAAGGRADDVVGHVQATQRRHAALVHREHALRRLPGRRQGHVPGRLRRTAGLSARRRTLVRVAVDDDTFVNKSQFTPPDAGLRRVGRCELDRRPSAGV